MDKYPHFNTDTEIYKEGGRLLGIGSVTQPNIQAVTMEVNGNGLGGAVEMPVAGHVQPMQVTIKYRVLDASITEVITPEYQKLETWTNMQTHDKATGQLVHKQQKAIIRGIPSSINMGELTAGSAQEIEVVLNVDYYKLFLDNKEICEIDKLNMIYKIDGKDYFSDIRKNLGL